MRKLKDFEENTIDLKDSSIGGILATWCETVEPNASYSEEGSDDFVTTHDDDGNFVDFEIVANCDGNTCPAE